MSAVAAARAVSAFLVCVLLASNAHADALKDCNTREDLELRIKGCTSLIAAKKKLSKAGLIDAYVKRGEAYFQKKEEDLALADFNKCIELNPKDDICWSFKALIHDNKLEVAEGINAYTKSINLSPTQDNERRCLTLLQRANAYYTKVLMETAQSVLVQEMRGRTEHREDKKLDSSYNKNLENAVADATACIQLNPSKEDAYAKRANYFYMLTRPKEAAADAAKAFELNPKNIDAVALLALTAFDDKDYARSLELAQRWRELAPDDSKAAEHIAKSMDALGHKDEASALLKATEGKKRCDAAIEALQQKKETNLDDGIAGCSAVIETKAVDQQWLVVAHEYRALLNAHKKNYEGAVADYTRCLELAGGEGQNVLYYQQRGNYPVELGQYQRAVADFDAALKQAPDDAASLENRAYSYRQLGELEKAKSDYTELKRLNPNRVSVYAHLGDIESLNKNFAAAFENYSKLIELVPTEGRNQARASTLEQLGRKDEAIADYRKALSLDATLTESVEGLKRLGSTP